MSGKFRITRSSVVIQLRHRLEADSFPRMQMMLIVILTGGFGLLSSFLMLHAGVDSMAMRYPLAVLCAYVFFILMLWIWLRFKSEDYWDGDLPGVEDINFPSPRIPRMGSGGGGDYAGGGASGSFDDVAATSFDNPLSGVGDHVSSVGDALDLDELAIPIIGVILAIGLAFASLYLVYLAPALFAELLFDGALSYTLYRRLRRQDSSHWIETALRRTWIVFLVTGVFVAAVGLACQTYAPGATTIGQVVNGTRAGR